MYLSLGETLGVIIGRLPFLFSLLLVFAFVSWFGLVHFHILLFGSFLSIMLH